MQRKVAKVGAYLDVAQPSQHARGTDPPHMPHRTASRGPSLQPSEDSVVSQPGLKILTYGALKSRGTLHWQKANT